MSSVAASDPTKQPDPPCDHRGFVVDLRDPVDDPPWYCTRCLAAFGDHEAHEIMFADQPGLGKVLDRMAAEEREVERREAPVTAAAHRARLEQQEQERRRASSRETVMRAPRLPGVLPSAPARVRRGGRTGTGLFASADEFKRVVINEMAQLLHNHQSPSELNVAEKLGLSVNSLRDWIKHAPRRWRTTIRWSSLQRQARVKMLADAARTPRA